MSSTSKFIFQENKKKIVYNFVYFNIFMFYTESYGQSVASVTDDVPRRALFIGEAWESND